MFSDLSWFYLFYRVEPETPPQNEPKFIVFYSMLTSLFAFCFNCREDGTTISVEAHGTMATVKQHCSKCDNRYTWRSQPLVLGRYPAANILLSFAVLMAGASISKVLLVLRHMGLSVISARTFFYHQRKFVFPLIIKYWNSCREKLVIQLKGMKDLVWCGDGRFDSMGHSAKYGVYTMLNCTVSKIIHFELLQVSKIFLTLRMK